MYEESYGGAAMCTKGIIQLLQGKISSMEKLQLYKPLFSRDHIRNIMAGANFPIFFHQIWQVSLLFL